MSAFERAFNALWEVFGDAVEADAVLRQIESDHAHELAEKIRDAAPPELPDTCYREAADLIDPEKPDA